jgi:hypothetical protein
MPRSPTDDPSDTAADSYLRALNAWVTSVEGWPETNWIEFSVEGNSRRATILTGLRVNLISRTPLTSKTVLSMRECPPSAGEVRPFEADFSTTPPRVRAGTDTRPGPAGETKPVTFPFTVSETDPEIFDLAVVDGPECDCLWTATLSYTQAGRSYTALIDDDGQPFHGVPHSRVPIYHPPVQ